MRTRSEMLPSGQRGNDSTNLAGIPLLQRERNRLMSQALGLGNLKPTVLTHPGLPDPTEDTGWVFRSEELNQSELKKFKKQKKKVYFQRTMNSFAVMGMPTQGHSLVPVIPEYQKLGDLTEEKTYHLLGFASPLTDGARRAARAIAGYTPLYKNKSNPQLWQMQTKLLIAEVKAPYMGKLSFFGCEIPCVIFPSAERDDLEYGVQNPDAKYKPYWDAAMAVWAVEHALGNTEAFRPWVDVDLAASRPWYMPVWTMRVLRYEHGLPAEHPGDPARRAMLGLCRTLRKGRRAPRTENEWLAITSPSDIGDDEAGESDAGSINDDVELGLPTSSHWDPVTKKSTTPRGDEPHPYPEQVALELQRIREHGERIVQEDQLPGPSGPTAAGLPRPAPAPSAQFPSSTGRDSQDVGMTGMNNRASSVRMSSPGGTDRDAVGEDDPMSVCDVPMATEGVPGPLVSHGGISTGYGAERETQDTPTLAPQSQSQSQSQSQPEPEPAPRRLVEGTGPPRTFAPPLPNAPTVRTGHRSGKQIAPGPDLSRDETRGFTVEPQ